MLPVYPESGSVPFCLTSIILVSSRPERLPTPVIPAVAPSHPCHPGRGALPPLSSRPWRLPAPVIPAGAQRRAGIHRGRGWPAEFGGLRQASNGSRISLRLSGMTGVGGCPGCRENPHAVIPAGALSHPCHPGRSAAESRDPSGLGWPGEFGDCARRPMDPGSACGCPG
jgi:hypothetical protein